MQKIYAARKYRQLKAAISKLKKLLLMSGSENWQLAIKRLKQKIKSLIDVFRGKIAPIRIRRILAGLAFVVLGVSSNHAFAQHYNQGIPSPQVIDNTIDRYVDLDLDGDLDVLSIIRNSYYNTYNGHTYFETYIGYQLNTVVNELPTFSAPTTILSSTFNEEIDLSVSDIDSDGDMDIIINSEYFHSDFYGYDRWNKVWYYKNNGINGNLDYVSSPLVNNFYVPNYSREPIMCDLDGDGDLDLSLIVSGSGPYNYEGVQYYQNNGTQTSPSFSGSVMNPFGLSPIPAGTSKFQFLDLNEDGDFDLLAYGPSSVYLYENIGTPTAPNFSAGVANPYGLTIGSNNAVGQFLDFDQDSDFDFVTVGSNGDFKFFENTGTSSPVFDIPIIDPYCIDMNAEINPQITVGDFNGDGDVDIMSRLSYYDNAPLPTITATIPSTFCGNTTQLSATSSGGVINWYDAPSGGNLLGSGTTFTTPSISAPTSFYAAVADGSCQSPRTAVLASPTACTKLKSWYCNRYLVNFNDYMACDPVPGATSYRFEMDDGLEQLYYENPTGGMRFNLVPGMKYGTFYTVKAAAKVNGVWMDYGPSCNVTTPLTKIQPWYCGLTVNPMNQYLACYAVSGATQYKFKLVNGQTTLYYTSNSVGFRMSWVPGIQTNTTYQVSVSSYANGLWSDFGPACAITSAASMQYNPENDQVVDEMPTDLEVQLFPNPTNGNFTIFLDQIYSEVDLSITDVQGKIILNKIVNDVNEVNLELQEAEGVYFVHVQIEGREAKVLKLVKH